MSRLVLFLGKDQRIPADLLYKISKFNKIGILDTKQRINNHEPTIDQEIFSQNDENIADKLVELLSSLDNSNVTYEAFEVPEKSGFNPLKKYFSLNQKILNNMISEHNNSIRYQRDIAYLEDPDL